MDFVTLLQISLLDILSSSRSVLSLYRFSLYRFSLLVSSSLCYSATLHRYYTLLVLWFCNSSLTTLLTFTGTIFYRFLLAYSALFCYSSLLVWSPLVISLLLVELFNPSLSHTHSISFLIQVEYLIDFLSHAEATLSPLVATFNDFGFHIYNLVFLPKPNSKFRRLWFPHQPWGKPNPIRSYLI